MIPSIAAEIRDLHGLLGSSRDPEGRAFVPLADAYRRGGDPVRALEVLESGLPRHPDSASAHLIAGLTYRDLGDDDRAAQAFERVLEVDAGNARALVGLGRILVARGDWARGEDLIEQGYALDATLAPVDPPRSAPPPPPPPPAPPAPPPESEEAGLEAVEWEVVDIDLLQPAFDDEPAALAARAAPVVPAAPVAPAAPVVPAAPVAPVAVTAAGAALDDDDEVVDIAELFPDPVVDTVADTVVDAVADDTPPLPVEALAPDPFDLSALTPRAEGDPQPVDTAEDGEGWMELDIDWDLPAAAAPAASPAAEPVTDEPVGAEPVADEPVGAEPVAEERPAAEPVAEAASPAWVDDDLVVDLASLAPDPPVGRVDEEFDDADEALPTRTLGELYARQGLHAEAAGVFEALLARSPDDADLRARLDELRGAARGGSTPPPAAPAPRLPERPGEVTSPEVGPPVGDYFAALLGWTPAGEPPDGRGARG